MFNQTGLTRRVGSTGDLDSLFGDMENIFGNSFVSGLGVQAFNHGNYPPFNILDGSVEVAVAGFKKDELSVKTEDGVLTISGKQGERSDRKIIQKGISERDFKLSFKIPKYGRVSGSSLVDGILTVNLVTIVPDEFKPTDIAID